MKLFGKKEDQKAETYIAELEASNEALQSNLDAANEAIVAKDQSIATLTNEKQTLVDANAELIESNEKLTSDLDQAKADIKAAEESANAKAVQKIASVGHTEKIEPEETNNGSKELTRAEFNKLSASEKSVFCIEGGRSK